MAARNSAEKNPRYTDGDTFYFQFLTKINTHTYSQRENKYRMGDARSKKQIIQPIHG